MERKYVYLLIIGVGVLAVGLAAFRYVGTAEPLDPPVSP